MDRYVTVDGKRLRLGYTTGSCAAAAAKAAAYMLLTGRRLETVKLLTPKGIPLELSLREIALGEGKAVCAVEKDGGDDPDVTDGALVAATVSLSEIPGIHIDGGQGVGRALYEYVVDFARRAGCYNLTLNVWSCNPSALRFYEKCGLTPQKIGMETIL